MRCAGRDRVCPVRAEEKRMIDVRWRFADVPGGSGSLSAFVSGGYRRLSPFFSVQEERRECSRTTSLQAGPVPRGAGGTTLAVSGCFRGCYRQVPTPRPRIMGVDVHFLGRPSDGTYFQSPAKSAWLGKLVSLVLAGDASSGQTGRCSSRFRPLVSPGSPWHTGTLHDVSAQQ